MHYGPRYFSKNFKKTIIVKDDENEIGQRRVLSVGDILQTNLLYRCSSTIFGKVINYRVLIRSSFDLSCLCALCFLGGCEFQLFEPILLNYDLKFLLLECSLGCKFDHITPVLQRLHWLFTRVIYPSSFASNLFFSPGKHSMTKHLYILMNLYIFITHRDTSDHRISVFYLFL